MLPVLNEISRVLLVKLHLWKSAKAIYAVRMVIKTLA